MTVDSLTDLDMINALNAVPLNRPKQLKMTGNIAHIGMLCLRIGTHKASNIFFSHSYEGSLRSSQYVLVDNERDQEFSNFLSVDLIAIQF